jgi:large-conductance mechanosensitive channel
MTATVTTETTAPAAPRTADRPSRQITAPIRPIPLSRVTAVELRKMFDTRSGFWLMASIVIASVLATGAVIIFAPDAELTYSTFASAIGFPMAVILPMIAVLSVTSEWSQRSGLTTFTLVPRRGRVILAKAIGTVGVAVVSMVLAMGIGALGNLAGSALAGVPATWDSSVTDLLNIVLGNVVGLMVGFMLGVVIRNSAGAIVAYFVLTLVLPVLGGVLAATASWYRDLQPWVDINYAQVALFNGDLTGQQWANLGVTSVIWLLIPLVIGIRLILRSEVK